MRDQIADDRPSNREIHLAKTNPRQRAWLEVSASAIEANARALKRHLAPSCELMAVVKADGYGHGAETVAKASLRGGATSFGVATLQEGIDLRNAGLNEPVLVLGHLSQPEDLRACLQWQLMPTLSSMREALLCQNLADSSGRPFAVQLKIDTGMTRLGCDWQDGSRLADAIQQLDQLTLNGIYSHLALADGERDGEAARFTKLQEERFNCITRELNNSSTKVKRHLANSAGTLRDSNLHHDLVRVGLALYGHSPSQYLDGIVELEPAISVKARVSLIRDVPSGIGVSYGHRFVTQRPSRLAVVSIGYADGVSRCLSGRIHALHDGHVLPQVGAITMDQLTLDATDHRTLESGDVVTLLGRDGEHTISPRSWAELANSIPWEVLCSFKHRLPRLVI